MNNAGKINIPHFKLYYRAIVIKPAWHWHKNRRVDPWNKIEDPSMSTCDYSHWYLMGSKKCTMKNRQQLQQTLLRQLDIHGWKNKIRHTCIYHLPQKKKINSKWMKDLQCETPNSKTSRQKHRQYLIRSRGEKGLICVCVLVYSLNEVMALGVIILSSIVHMQSLPSWLLLYFTYWWFYYKLYNIVCYVTFYKLSTKAPGLDMGNLPSHN